MTARRKNPLVMSDKELDTAVKGAVNPILEDPEIATFGYGKNEKKVKLPFFNLRKQQGVIKILLPYLPAILDAMDSEGNFDALLGVGEPLVDEAHKIIAIAFDLDPEWLLDNSDIPQIIKAALPVIKKIGSTQLLGELYRQGVQKRRQKKQTT